MAVGLICGILVTPTIVIDGQVTVLLCYLVTWLPGDVPNMYLAICSRDVIQLGTLNQMYPYVPKCLHLK